jgi:hypothetical protein
LLLLLYWVAEAEPTLTAERSAAAAAAAKSFCFMDMVLFLGSQLGLRAGRWG